MCIFSCRNAAWNGLTALTDLDTDTYLTSSPSAEPIARNLMIEMAAISRALGIEIDPHRYYKDTPEKLTEKQRKQNDGKTVDDMLVDRVRSVGPLTSSMRVDVQNGRALESGVSALIYRALVLLDVFSTNEHLHFHPSTDHIRISALSC